MTFLWEVLTQQYEDLYSCPWLLFANEKGRKAGASGCIRDFADGYPHRTRYSRGHPPVEPLFRGRDDDLLHHCQVWLAHVVRYR